MSDSERLFFALWPTPQQQRDWADVAQQLLPPGAGRLLPVQNLHLTLLFLGELTSETRQELEARVDTIRGHAFELRLERFGHWRRPQVLWWGPRETPEPLQHLVEELRRAARACGLEVERRPYQAHLTLARKVRRNPGRLQAESRSWPVDEFVLARSTLLPEGARYDVQRRWRLGLAAPDMG
jgi:2'-5' RNA ligase